MIDYTRHTAIVPLRDIRDETDYISRRSYYEKCLIIVSESKCYFATHADMYCVLQSPMTSNSEKREKRERESEWERLFCKHYPSRGKHKGWGGEKLD